MRWATERTAIAPLALLSLSLLAASIAAGCATTGTADTGGDSSTAPPSGDSGHPRADAADAAVSPQPDATQINFGDTGTGSSGDGATTPDGSGSGSSSSSGSGSGSSPGSGSGSGSGSPEDGGTPPPGDASSKDGSVNDAVATDAGSKDTGAVDTGTKDTGAVDSAKDTSTTCTAVTVPTGDEPGAGACGPPSSLSTCQGPGSVSGFTPTAPPPSGLHQGYCSTTQIQAIYNDCLTPTGTCGEADADDPAYLCYGCIFTGKSASKWGPLVADTNNVVSINFGGCLELLEPCNAACATAIENDYQCEEYACAANCKSSVTAYEGCAQTIDGCTPGCNAYYYASSCQTAITGADHPGATCFSGSDFESAFLAVAAVFCGN